MKKIGISTDCMCDLPADHLAANDIEVMQFYIHTAIGSFWTESEVTSDNILEYLGSTSAHLGFHVPEPEECRGYFADILTRYDEVIHITASDKVGLSYSNAKAALELMGEEAKRITLVNSGSISTGLGHMVLLAVRLRDSGKSTHEIAQACNAMRDQISCSFIVPNADYLYRVGYVGQRVRNLCRLFNIHPVLCTKNGKFTVKAFRMGKYENAVIRYIRSELKGGKKIDKRQLFITHAGYPAKSLAQVRAKVENLCKFDRVTTTKASAVTTCLCGPETIGVLFVYQ